MSELEAVARRMRQGGWIYHSAALAPITSSGAFRVLLTAQLVGILGRWMQSLTAQWALVHDSPAMVALVPTMMSLPVVLFALLMGAFADLFDRRRMLLVTQAGLGVTAAAMAAFSVAGLATPWLTLGLMFLMGTWTAANMPPFQSAISEVVPKEHVVQAATLTAVGANIGRAIGPAIAGGVVVATGLGGGFGIGALAYFAAFAYTTRVGSLGVPIRPTEKLGEAIRAGNRYVRHSQMTTRVLFWSVVYVALNAALWGLLPSLAERRLGLGASGYGLLMGAVGLGALLGALAMPFATKRWSNTQLFGMGSAMTAVATIAITLVPNAALAGITLIPFGVGYIIVIALTNGTLQLALPRWVRARGLAWYLVSFHIAMAGGSAAWGFAASTFGVSETVVVSGIVLLATAPLLAVIRLPDTASIENSEGAAWPEPQLALDVAARDGAVTVTTVFRVAKEHHAEFVTTMERVGRARRRTGACRHELLQEASSPDTFIERYVTPSWQGYVRQQAECLTPSDREQVRRARGLAYEVGESRHWVTPPPSVEAPAGDEG